MSPDLFSPVKTGSTLTDERETTGVPVVVVSCSARGKVVYQYVKKDREYFMKNMLS